MILCSKHSNYRTQHPSTWCADDGKLINAAPPNCNTIQHQHIAYASHLLDVSCTRAAFAQHQHTQTARTHSQHNIRVFSLQSHARIALAGGSGRYHQRRAAHKPICNSRNARLHTLPHARPPPLTHTKRASSARAPPLSSATWLAYIACLLLAHAARFARQAIMAWIKKAPHAMRVDIREAHLHSATFSRAHETCGTCTHKYSCTLAPRRAHMFFARNATTHTHTESLCCGACAAARPRASSVRLSAKAEARAIVGVRPRTSHKLSARMHSLERQWKHFGVRDCARHLCVCVCRCSRTAARLLTLAWDLWASSVFAIWLWCDCAPRGEGCKI